MIFADIKNMKKLISFILILFSISSLIFSVTPEQITGIWEGKDRFIYFGPENEVAFILKDYYSWYYDRVVEPEYFSSLSKRNRNAATPKKPLTYYTSFLAFNDVNNAWEITIHFDKKSSETIPVAIENDKIYLSFLIKVPEKPSEDLKGQELKDFLDAQKTVFGYWQGLNCNDSIRIDGRNNIQNVYSWFITQDGIYRLRFWETNMEFNPLAIAQFTDGERLFQLNKHIYSCGATYSCTEGRSSRIRNVEKFNNFPQEYSCNDDFTLLFLGSPYLTKLKDQTTEKELLEIVEKQFKVRKPYHYPLMPVREFLLKDSEPVDFEIKDFEL